jgi:hypothetical protein
MKRQIFLIVVLLFSVFFTSCEFSDLGNIKTADMSGSGSGGSNSNGNLKHVSVELLDRDSFTSEKEYSVKKNVMLVLKMQNPYDYYNPKMQFKFTGFSDIQMSTNKIQEYVLKNRFDKNSGLIPETEGFPIGVKSISSERLRPEITIKYCYEERAEIVRNICVPNRLNKCEQSIDNSFSKTIGSFDLKYDVKIIEDGKRGIVNIWLSKVSGGVLNNDCFVLEDKRQKITYEVFEIKMTGLNKECTKKSDELFLQMEGSKIYYECEIISDNSFADSYTDQLIITMGRYNYENELSPVTLNFVDYSKK